MLNMSIPYTPPGIHRDEDHIFVHDDVLEEPRARLVDSSRKTSVSNVWHSDTIKKDDEDSPRLRHRSTMLSMSTHYTESNFGSHTELSEVLVTRTVSGAGMCYKHQKSDAGFSIARERRKRLQEERLGRAVRPRENATAPDLEINSSPWDTVESAGSGIVPGAGHESKVVLDEAKMKAKPWTTAHQRVASAEATARLIRHAREVLIASDAELLRLRVAQNGIRLADGPIPQRRNTTGLLPRKTTANYQSKRATAHDYTQVTGAERDLGGIPKPSKRVQELMDRFDREIKARVQADIEQRRRLRQGQEKSSGIPHIQDESKDADPAANMPAKQERRPNMAEQDRALSSSETIVANETEPTDGDDLQISGGLAERSKDLYEQVESLDRTTSVEDEVSAGLDLSHISSYDEGIVISEKAVAAPMVPVRKARLIKVTPRPVSVNIARNEDPEARVSSPRSRTSQTGGLRSQNHTPTKQHPVDGQNDGSSSPRMGLNKKELQLAKSLQPEDFVVSADMTEKRKRKTARKYSRSTSPFERPSGSLSCRLGGRDEGQSYDDQDMEGVDDQMSLSSLDCATEHDRNASATVPLFNMPNSPFLYHREQDDECPSLTTDDEQDRQTEETGLAGQDQAPPPLSPPSGRPSQNVVRAHTTTRGKYAQVNVGDDGDGFSAISDDLHQGEDCSGCEGDWRDGIERYGQGTKRCSFPAAAVQWAQSN